MDHQLDAQRDALFSAIIEDNSGAFNELLKLGLNVIDRKDPIFGFTPLMVASRAGNLEAATCLLRKSHASLDAVNVRQQTALMLAVSNGRIEVANKLIEEGADTQLQDVQGKTAQALADEKNVFGIQFRRI